MPGSQLEYLAGKVHIHRWPMDSPEWDDSIRQEIDDIIKNPQKIPVTFKDESVLVGNVEFYRLKKIGISVPFFKEECAVIFEAKFGSLFGHVHVHIESPDFVNIFNDLTLWKAKIPGD